MDKSSKTSNLISFVLGLGAIITAALGWYRDATYSLPLPIAISILTTIFSIVGPLALATINRVSLNTDRQSILLLQPYLRYLLAYVPMILLVLVIVYGWPTQVLSCSLEMQWSHLFRTKNENAVRAIENGLRCCGFNSVSDRAFPFVGHGVDVRACERTLGYTRPCAPQYRQQEQIAAGLLFVANLFTWIVMHLVDVGAAEYRITTRTGALAQPERTRLLRSEDEDQEEGRRVLFPASYSDDN